MAQNTDFLPLALSTGAEIPLRPIVSGSGNKYHATLATRKDGSKWFSPKYGVNVEGAVVGGALPTWVKFQGKRFTLVMDVSPTTGKARAHTDKPVKVTVDGEEKQLSFRISDQGDGRFNIAASINGIGGGKKAAVSTL